MFLYPNSAYLKNSFMLHEGLFNELETVGRKDQVEFGKSGLKRVTHFLRKICSNMDRPFNPHSKSFVGLKALTFKAGVKQIMPTKAWCEKVPYTLPHPNFNIKRI